jgi:hypothetical protein
MAVDGSAGRLDDKDIRAADVFLYLKVDFAVGKLTHSGRSQRAPKLLTDLRSKFRVGSSGEHPEVIKSHGFYVLLL